MSDSTASRVASRPYVPGYGIPKSVKGTLPWSHVVERMAKARNYWIATARLDGRVHAVPVWGVWVDDTLYFGGGETQWARNLKTNPNVAVHLDSSDDVVTLEGSVERISDPNHPMAKRIDDAYEAKYQMRHGLPVWVLRPRVVYAWSQFPANATRWTVDT
jgi:hypothetical protein